MKFSDLGGDKRDLSTRYAFNRWHVTQPPMVRPNALRCCALEALITVMARLITLCTKGGATPF
ncbi:hypothetical protein [Planktotalea arctica]|uniref:hypothetical protein n=1 Tax=Planktotalea arctica TaxID=1481893 RepID=UPI003D2F5C9C